MDNLTLKYNLLDNFSKQEVLDFVEFLLSKKNKKSTLTTSNYQKDLLSISNWDEETLKQLEQNNHFNSWQPKTW